MFKNWGNWLGTEDKNVQVKQEHDSSDDVNGDKYLEVNKASVDADPELSGAQPQLIQQAKGFSGYIYSFASSTSKKLSDSVVETAQTLKKSVEDGKIAYSLIDKTILGDFQKEQDKFVQEKKAKRFSTAVPPWVGYNDEDSVQQQILALSVVSFSIFRSDVFFFYCNNLTNYYSLTGQKKFLARPSCWGAL